MDDNRGDFMTHSDSMRALVLQDAGGQFQDVRLPRPTPGPGQVLVRIHASGVNPLDLKIAAGQAAHARQALPAVLGMDLAGTVEALGSGVDGLAVGDAVYGMAGGIGGLQGSLAEWAAVDADLLALKPRSLSMREAAALPLVSITAWEGLVDRAQVHTGQQVLVHGGAGGVGHVAVQMARALGAVVAATGHPRQADVIHRLGATPIDFTTATVDEYVAQLTRGEGFDVVYDTVGGAVLDASFTAVRRHGGHVVSCLGWGTHLLAPLSFRAATYSGVFTLLPMLTGQGRAHHGHILREVALWVDAGQLRPLMDPRRFDLGSAMQAHEHLASGQAQGRVVVEAIAA
jgi:NADPH:quinone reductase